MRWVSVGEGALLVYTMPLWATLFAWLVLGTRATRSGFVSLLLGFAGTVVLVGGQGMSAVGDGQVLGMTCFLLAAVLFAHGMVLNRTALPLPLVASTAWQIGLGCAPMVMLGVLFEAPRVAALTWPEFRNLAYMAVVPMGLCYVTWFAALRRLPASTASVAMLIVSLLGIVSAAVALRSSQ